MSEAIAIREESALVKERRNQIALRHGLPTIGTQIVSKYNVEWLVDGHLYAPSHTSQAEGHTPADEDPRDLHPVILPQNFSTQLNDFISETDRCTSKYFTPLDTVPHLRPRYAHPDGHSIDAMVNPYHIFLYLDAVHAQETIIAHEIAHVWIDAVEDCEDYRTLGDVSNSAKAYQWTSLQSFVLDKKVNEVLRRKGFDMGLIDKQQEETLANLSTLLLGGHYPPTRHEAAFLASNLATAMLDEEAKPGTYTMLDLALMVTERDLPEMYTLACRMADVIRRYGCSDRKSIGQAVDACALLSYGFTGDKFDPDRDLVEEPPAQMEVLEDKYPQWLSGFPVEAKLELGKIMARMQIPNGSEYRITRTSGGNVYAAFLLPSGEWTTPVLLPNLHHLPPPYPGHGWQPPMQKGKPIVNKPITPPSPPNAMRPTVQSPSVPSPSPIPPNPGFPPGRRTYGVGMARFLTQTRLEEMMDGSNAYAYAMNNPATYVMPDGILNKNTTRDHLNLIYPKELLGRNLPSFLPEYNIHMMMMMCLRGQRDCGQERAWCLARATALLALLGGGVAAFVAACIAGCSYTGPATTLCLNLCRAKGAALGAAALAAYYAAVRDCAAKYKECVDAGGKP